MQDSLAIGTNGGGLQLMCLVLAYDEKIGATGRCLHHADRPTFTTQGTWDRSKALAFVVGQAIGLEMGTASSEYVGFSGFQLFPGPREFSDVLRFDGPGLSGSFPGRTIHSVLHD